jgi:hypothetical protein
MSEPELNTSSLTPSAPRHKRQGIDYYGVLSTVLRDLQGHATLINELIQNADDAPGVKTLIFDVREDALVVENDSSFREEDFERLQNVASGAKRAEDFTTGAFGIGFSAVYQITDAPEITSAGLRWVLHPERPEEERIDEYDAPDDGRTHFRFPWALDPNSPLRVKLQLQAMRPGEIERLVEVFTESLPSVVVFLRKLEQIELRRDGAIIKAVQRYRQAEEVLVQDGDATHHWHLFQGSFGPQAETLRRQFGNKIEAKRSADVTVAIHNTDADLKGVFCAFLPTQHLTGLPFLVNADFFPSSSRKMIVLEDDYQGQWNKAAISAAAVALASNLSRLPQLLGAQHLWKLLSKLEAVAREAASGQREPVMGQFWTKAWPRLTGSAVVLTSAGEWRLPAESLLLEKEDEIDSLSVLQDAGIQIVTPELRPYFSLMRNKQVGVPLMGLGHLAEALQRAGLNKVLAESDLPAWLRQRAAREQLGREIEILLGKHPGSDLQGDGRKDLAACSIAQSMAGDYRAPRYLWLVDRKTAEVFSPLGLEPKLLAFDNHAGVVALAPAWTTAAAISELERLTPAVFSALWQTEPEKLYVVVDWFMARSATFRDDATLARRLRSLSVWPSGLELRPLDKLAVPGDFEDELCLASIVDKDFLEGRHDFLRVLEAPELTIGAYVSRYVPQAFAEREITSDSRRSLVTFLARHLNQFREDDGAREGLSPCPLVECVDGQFRIADEVYLPNSSARALLGPGTHVAVEPGENKEAIIDLYRWLGVAAEARLSSLLARIRLLIQHHPTEEIVRAIERIYAYLGRAYRPDGTTNDDYDELRTLAWLPAVGDDKKWYRPSQLDAIFSKSVFESQGVFINIDRRVQQEVSKFQEYLGVKATPTQKQIVNHILHCANMNIPVDAQAYRFLNDYVQKQSYDPIILSLKGKPSIQLEGGRYTHPENLFWGEHPFGRYRFTLKPELKAYVNLFNILEVHQSYSEDDALKVLNEISAEFGSVNRPLDEHAHEVVMRCWTILNTALEENPDLLARLAPLRNSDRKIIPNSDWLLQRADWMFFEDRPGLKEKFGNYLKPNAIARTPGTWRAMEAAGVSRLSDKVEIDLLECKNAIEDVEITKRLRERRTLIARVLNALNDDREINLRLEVLDGLAVKRVEDLVIRYTLEFQNSLKRSQPEPTEVYYDRSNTTLFYQTRNGRIPWSALARELAYGFRVDAEAGLIAAGLKEVLSADSISEADFSLSDLGYAPLGDMIAVDLPPSEVVGLGGTDLQHTGDDSSGESFIPADNLDGDRVTTPAEAINLLLGGEPTQITPPPEELNDLLRDPSKTNTSSTGQRTGTRRGASSGSGGRLRTYVSPDKQEGEQDGSTEEGEVDRRVEQAGIKKACEHESEAGRTPKVMEPNHPGYDIESRGLSGEIERYIEVKATAGKWSGQGVGVSGTQFKRALELRDRYWLYVVEYAGTGTERLYRINNPAARVEQYLYDDGWRDYTEIS